MSVITVNLIQKSERYRRIARLTHRLKILCISIAITSIAALVVLFVYNNILFERLNSSIREYENVLRTEFTESKKIPEVAFAYGKLMKASELYDTAPDYVDQYRYTIEKLIGDAPVEIESLNFTSDRTCTLALLSQDPYQLYRVIQRIEDEQDKQNYSSIQLDGITTTERRVERQSVSYFRVSFKMTFSKGFNAD